MKNIRKEMENISKKVGTAIYDYDMLHEGDKVLVGISGGKDSLTLLRMLKYRQSFAPIKFDILAVHVDMNIPGMHVNKLEDYFNENKIEYHIEKINFLDGKEWEDIGCFWCSWNRRKAFFELAERLGYNKIAYGHHFDDIVETILMNLFYQGNISAMLPNQELFDGKLRIIRPLAYVEERHIEAYAKKEDYPSFMSAKCVHDDNTKRAEIKRLLEDLTKNNDSIKTNIFKGVRRVKADYLL